MTGLFVVLEGGYGVGKSTQTKLLADWAAENSLPFRITFEPGTTETPLSFCPAFLYDGGELAGVQDAADLAQLTPDFEPAVPGQVTERGTWGPCE